MAYSWKIIPPYDQLCLCLFFGMIQAEKNNLLSFCILPKVVNFWGGAGIEGCI